MVFVLMHQYRFVLLAFALVGCTRSWVTFSPPTGDFSVSAPAPLTDSPETVNLPFGRMERHRYHVKSNGTYFAVEVVDYPTSLPVLDQSEALDAGRDGAIAATRGHLIEESPITLGRIGGRQVKISADGGRLVSTARFFLVGRRLYGGIVVRRSSAAETDTWRFLDSLQIRGQ